MAINFTLIDAETGQSETFPPDNPRTILLTKNSQWDSVPELIEILDIAIESNEKQPQPIWSGDLKFVRAGLYRVIKRQTEESVRFLDSVSDSNQAHRNEAIEQCAQMADIEADRWGEFSNQIADTSGFYAMASDTARHVATRIRALITSPQPESPRNITQEQAVIAALVDACKAASEYINLVGLIPVDDLFQKHTDLNEKLQDALALADTLKKGESKCEKDS